jgi:hypothetical protein
MRSSLTTLAVVFLVLLSITYLLIALDVAEDTLTVINLAQDAAGLLLALSVVYAAYRGALGDA